MTTEQERNKIKKRMEVAGIKAGPLIMESKYTALRNFLNGEGITVDKLNDLKQALTRLEGAKTTQQDKAIKVNS
jgi:hypothetical protein